MSKRDWYNFTEANNRTEILIYDEISYYGISAQQFVSELNELDVDEITLRINSPGGSVFQGIAIFNAIKAHKAKVTVHVDGLAASIASIIALAGDEVHIAENAYFMIHQPWTVTLGTADDLRDEANLLDKLEGTLVDIYSKRMDKSANEIRDLLKAETWMDGKEAKEAGLATHVTEDQAEVEAKHDLTQFDNAPSEINAGKTPPKDKREFERSLRELGFSRSASVEIASKTFDDAATQSDSEKDVNQYAKDLFGI